MTLFYGPIVILGDSLLQIISWALVMLFVVFALLMVFQLRLNKGFGIMSVISYLVYISFIFNTF